MRSLRAPKKHNCQPVTQLSPVKEPARRISEIVQSCEAEIAVELRSASNKILSEVVSFQTIREKIHSLALRRLIALAAFFIPLSSSVEAQQSKSMARIGYLTPGDSVSRRYRVE